MIDYSIIKRMSRLKITIAIGLLVAAAVKLY